MAEGFVAVDTEGLARTGGDMNRVSEDVRTIGKTLLSRLNGIGEPWGSDGNGESFAAEYVPARDEFFDTTDKLCGTIDSTGDGILTMARNYTKTEETNYSAASG